jgi:tRNA 2-selenouridine synthase
MELEIDEFLQLGETYNIVDVRTPAEFEIGHIPGAFNIPLFSNEERVIVGTIYKQKSKELAVEKGLEFVGPKLLDFVKQAKKLAKEKKILVHCWRGGMRSKSMAWLFSTSGLEAYTLIGGYKSFRRKAKELFATDTNFKIIGGYTGSGKTEVIKALAQIGEQVIDLEGIANHKGSAFGHIGEHMQPTTEQFENNLFFALKEMDTNKTIWLEDESRSIGKVWIPDEIYTQMRTAIVVVLETSNEQRLQNLVKIYAGEFEENKEQLKFSIEKIEKRLGGLRTKNSLLAIENGDVYSAAAEILPYYDKTYSYGLSQRDEKSLIKLDNNKKNAELVAQEIAKLKFNK